MKQLLTETMGVSMIWPLRRRKIKLTREEVSPELKASQRQLRQVRGQWPEINSLLARLGNFNERNHYAEVIAKAIQGGKE